MSGTFSNSIRSKMLKFITINAGLTSPFRRQMRTYMVTSIPHYNMTDEKFSDPNGDQMGCQMEKKTFLENYENFCRVQGVSPELDSKTSTIISEMVGGKFQEVDDIHNQLQKPTKLHPVICPVKNVGDQPNDAPTSITWPAAYSDPIAEVGGLLKNVVYYNLKSEIERNVAFMESVSDQIAEGSASISSVLQYYVGYGPEIKFEDLNFYLEFKKQERLTTEQLSNEEVVKKYIHTYMDTILPAPIRKIKIDMEKQTFQVLHVQSPHSSLILEFPKKDGTKGYLGVEVGRPSHTYVEGNLVENAHEQAVDAAVFQFMNQKSIKLPKSISELEEMNLGITKENFAKFNTDMPIELLPDSSKPVVRAINLVNASKLGTPGQKNKDSYLSDGTPCAVTTQKISNGKSLAKILLTIVGQNPWEALRLGGYFAHKALTGQSRACEVLPVYGCDLTDINPSELFPILSELKEFDLSQEMRESLYENFLYIELTEDLPKDKTSDIFSINSATTYMDLAANSYACIQVYRDLLSAAQEKNENASAQNKRDSQAEEIYSRIEQQTRNLMHRYEHMWAIAAYNVINMYSNFGIDVLLDPVDESAKFQKPSSDNSKKTSFYLDTARALTNEKIKALEKKISAEGKTTQTNKKTVHQNSLDLAKKAIAKFDSIAEELSS